MEPTSNVRTRRPPVASVRHLVIITSVLLLTIFASSAPSLAQVAPVGLGTADGFAVLAGSTITNTGSTTITGDVGLHPGTAVTGFNSVTMSGSLHVDDAVAEQAKVDLVTAYNNAANRSPATSIGTALGGQTLQGGVYSSPTFGITGTLTLDAQGDPDTVWVFQAGSSLTTASASNVNLINGADACNVFWQVGSSATLGTGSSFTGTIMALTSITLTTGATIQGRALARNGAVTMDTNTITRTACTTSTPAPTPTPEPSDDATPTPVPPDGDTDGPSNGDTDGPSNGDTDGPSNGDTDAPSNGDTDAPSDGDTGTSPGDGTTTPPEDGTATPPGAVQTPTRVDAGAGGTAPTAGLSGGLSLLALTIAGGAIALLRRGTSNGT